MAEHKNGACGVMGGFRMKQIMGTSLGRPDLAFGEVVLKVGGRNFLRWPEKSPARVGVGWSVEREKEESGMCVFCVL